MSNKPTLTIEVREGYESEDSPGELVGKVVIGYDTGESGFQILNISQAEAITFRMTQSSRARGPVGGVADVRDHDEEAETMTKGIPNE